jgi:hypothetical protein
VQIDLRERHVLAKLVALDAALLSPDVDWLVTRREKQGLADEQPSSAALLPTIPRCQLVGQFSGTFPIGIDHDGRAFFIYIASGTSTTDFRAFLLGHLTLLAVMPAWTVRVVLPPALRRGATDYERAAREELASPLLGPIANDVNWYFFHRQRNTDWSRHGASGPDGGASVKARFRDCARRFPSRQSGVIFGMARDSVYQRRRRSWWELSKTAVSQ